MFLKVNTTDGEVYINTNEIQLIKKAGSGSERVKALVVLTGKNVFTYETPLDIINEIKLKGSRQ